MMCEHLSGAAPGDDCLSISSAASADGTIPVTLLEGPVRLVAGRGAALRPAPVKPELSTAHPPPKAKSRLFRAAEQADSTGFPVSMRAAASWLLEQAPPHTDAVWRAPPLAQWLHDHDFPKLFQIIAFFFSDKCSCREDGGALL